ncbi:MAG: rod shape-determining protein MreC, partial [Chloroflexales bacterium]|nr:rod shape-determining protein MreC [Chloroflexales bacterium]
AGTLGGARAQAGSWMSGIGGQTQAENVALRQQVSALQATVVAMQQTEVQNATLRQQLEIKQQNSWAQHMVPAEVTMRSPDAGRRTMTISIGADSGVKEGMAVIGQQGGSPPALVGIVEQVGPGTATVLLITDFGSQVSARVLHGPASATGVVRGQWQRGSRLRLEQVVAGASVATGDPVVTAGLTRQLDVDLPLQAIPPGIPLGTVEQTGADGRSLIATLRPFVDPDQVRNVWVILNP